MTKIALRVFFWLAIAAAVLAALYLGLKAADRRAAELTAPHSLGSGAAAYAELCAEAGTGLQRSLMIDEIASGALRYWMPDVDLLDIPAKKPGEFRVVLIGDLGNELSDHPRAKTFVLPELLERKLQAAVGRNGRTVRVMNFSAFGSNTYQNYLALNLAGYFSRPVEPDLIVAYTGFDDWVIPYYIEGIPEVECGFGEYDAAPFYASRPWEMPPGLRWIAALLPNIMKRTPLGFALKDLWDPDYFVRVGRAGYLRHRHLEPTDKRDMMDRYAIPFFLNALSSIQRDNGGVPVLLAWQAIAPDEFKPFGDPEAELGTDFYPRMFDRARAELPRLGDGRWLFLDVNAEAHAKNLDIGFDPSARAQDSIAAMIAAEIEREGIAK
jgi:hypothetical protein